MRCQIPDHHRPPGPGPLAAPVAVTALAVMLAAALVIRPAAAGIGDQEKKSVDEANRRCLTCHGQPHIGTLTRSDRLAMLAREAPPPPAPGPTSRPGPTTRPATAPVAPVADDARPGLYVGVAPLAGTRHVDLRCVDCHGDSEKLPHPRVLAPANCGRCHGAEQAAFDRSRHADALAADHPQAPRCSTCHGGHGILPPTGREAATHPLNVVRVCGDCHERHLIGDGELDRVQTYLDSVHGAAVVRGGLVSSATCADCHGYHEILPSSDPGSATHREHVPTTCGRCHLGVVESYQASIHGTQLAIGDERAPVCTDCHTAHRITRSGTPAFMLDIVNECGECHNDPELAQDRRVTFYRSYRASYHGQVNELGSTRAARCSDCHGAHDILPIADPDSRLHGEHRIQTCRACHEGAPARFAQFDPHADYRDRARYPLLHAVWWYFIIVMSSAFGFFGLHCLLWFVRSLIERVRRGPVPRAVANPHAIRRFTRLNRINHALMVIPFFGLTLTGLPLFFSDEPWAQTLATYLGGPAAVGVLHRVLAVVLLGNFVLHGIGLVHKARQHARGSLIRDWLAGPSTMLPRMKDFRDCAGMFRWFLVGGRKPSFDRWTYWEKFDYAAEIFGTLIIGGSGLLLWFPIFFSSFLPGWVFNVATIIHGYEALLAVGFIFTIHFFNAHLRMDKFPVDDVIFTGQLAEEEFEEERPAEYARMVATGEIEALKEEPAPPWQRRAAVVVGIVAMGIGFTIVALIIAAGLEAL